MVLEIHSFIETSVLNCVPVLQGNCDNFKIYIHICNLQKD